MSLKIILMDGNPYIKKTLHYFLQPYAPQIHTWNPPHDTSKDAPRVHADLVFLDSHHMQSKSQIENFKKQNIPMIFLSRENETISHSFQGELKKPIDPKKLQNLVNSLVPRTQNLKMGPFLEFQTLKEEESSPSKKEAPSGYFSNSILIGDEIIESDASFSSIQKNEKESTWITPPPQNSKIDKDQDSDRKPPSQFSLSSSTKEYLKEQIQKIQSSHFENSQKEKTPPKETLPEPPSPLKEDLVSKAIESKKGWIEEVTQKKAQEILNQNTQGDSIQKQVQKEFENIFLKKIKDVKKSEGMSAIREATQDTVQKDVIQKEIRLEINKNVKEIIKNEKIQVIQVIREVSEKVIPNILPELLKDFVQKQSLKEDTEKILKTTTTQEILNHSKDVIQKEVSKSTQTQEFQKLVQDIVWKVVPELARQMIQKEIDKENESDN